MLGKMSICPTGEQTPEEVEITKIKNDSFHAGYEQCKKEMAQTSHNSDYEKCAEEIQEMCEYGTSISNIMHYLQTHFS